MAEKKPNTILVEYRVSPNHAVHAITGVHGGVRSTGEVMASFFHEHPRIPNLIRIDLDTLKETPEEPSRTRTEREILYTFSMDIPTARAIGNWLLERVKDYERATAEEVENS